MRVHVVHVTSCLVSSDGDESFKPSLPTAQETGLSASTTKEVNKAVEEGQRSASASERNLRLRTMLERVQCV